MYKNILVAVDDSATSRCALDEAINIARATNARLHIVHVADEVLLGLVTALLASWRKRRVPASEDAPET